jgi:CRISPR system Cascade subunit CasD
MTSFMIFDLYGPISAFGDVAVGEYRPAYSHPSKSSIIGLIAASLGIDRKNEEELQSLSFSLNVGVLVVSSGHLLRDFHTVQVPSSSGLKGLPHSTRRDELLAKDLNTITSSRDYRTDAYYRIAVWCPTGTYSLDTLKEALEKPRYVPYLGRKSCPPALPFKPELIEAENIIQALRGYSQNMCWIKQLIGSTGTKNFELYTETRIEGRENEVFKVSRRDRLISRRAWQYGEREEILQFVGGNDVFE